MLLTDLLTAVTKSGLTVHTVAGWETRGDGEMDAVEGIVCHHTAGPASGNMPSLSTLIYGRPGLPGPLCNLGFARDGSVYVVAAGKANHAGLGSGFGLPTNDANPRMIGIEAESTGRGDWTAAQVAGWPQLNRALMQHYRFPDRMIIGHLEWAPLRKIDPHGWPGGMDGLRAQTVSPGEDDSMPFESAMGSSSLRQELAVGEARGLYVSDVKATSMVIAGSARKRVSGGVITLYLDAPTDVAVTVEAYLVKPSGKTYVYAGTFGEADFPAGIQHLRYGVTGDVPPGCRMRLRATQRGGSPRTVTAAIYNLDVRS